MISDPIADLLTRIRNAGMASLPDVTMPHSRMKEAVAGILKREGYIAGYAVEGDKKKALKVGLKYHGRRPGIAGLKPVSTPGLRRYVGATEIPRVLGGLGIAIVSTSKGLMTGGEARKQNLRGELVCYIW